MIIPARRPGPRKPVTLTMPVTGTVSSMYVFDTECPKCCFCGNRARRELTTGILPKVGVVWKCGECQGLYNEAKEKAQPCGSGEHSHS